MLDPRVFVDAAHLLSLGHAVGPYHAIELAGADPWGAHSHALDEHMRDYPPRGATQRELTTLLLLLAVVAADDRSSARSYRS